MTFKKDFNEFLLHILRGLVKDAVHFEEIVSGSASRMTNIEVKVDELRAKVCIMYIVNYIYKSQQLFQSKL